MFAPTIGFAGLLRSLDRGSYSVLMVSGSEGSAGLRCDVRVSACCAPACFVQLHLKDGFPWYKDDSVLD
jgi:hypothetical protein